jgi:hypothetical protein
MNRFYQALIVASLLSAPFVSYAQDSASPTRAEVRAQLINAEQAGQFPQSKTHYPDASPNTATTYVANKAAENQSYGSSASGSSASGHSSIHERIAASVQPSTDNIYQHH